MPPSCCAPVSRSGAALRWPTSPTSRSPAPRSPGSRSSRLSAYEERIEADLALWHDGELVSELEALVAAHPLRERLRGQLMLALYRSDRQAEALEAFRHGRHLLVEELGIEPSTSLRSLHERILAQDPALGGPGRTWRQPRARGLPGSRAALARRPRALVLAGVALLAGALSVAAAQALRGDPGPTRPAVPLTYSALAAVVPASGTVEAAVALPSVSRLAVSGGLVWVGGDDSRTVSAIDARTRRLVRTVPTGLFPSDVAAGAGSVWVVDGARGRVARIDPSYGRLLETVRFTPSGEAPPDRHGFDPTSVAVGAGAVWVTDGGRRLLRIDVGGGAATPISVRTSARGRGHGRGRRVGHQRRDGRGPARRPRTNRVGLRLPLVERRGPRVGVPRAIAAGGGYVWVLSGNTGVVTKVDPRTRGVVGTVKIAGADFLAEFRAETSQDPCCYTVHVAQAAHVLLDAIAASDGSRRSVTRELLRFRVRDGLIGDFSFDENGDVTPPTVSVYRIENGKQELLHVVQDV